MGKYEPQATWGQASSPKKENKNTPKKGHPDKPISTWKRLYKNHL